MKKTALQYGLLAGAAFALSFGITAAVDAFAQSSMQALEWLGYLVMFTALSLIFFGVKRYRDRELGGIIGFGKAFATGLGIALVASIIYVVAWEFTLMATDYAFIEEYTASIIQSKTEAGLSGEELLALQAEMDQMREQYGNPVFRSGMTFLEIFPVGLLIALISAALLRRPEILPEHAPEGS